MNQNLSAGKKKVVRKHILQQVADLYLHPVTERTLTANLKVRFPSLSVEQVRELFIYLEQKGLAVIRSGKAGQSLQVTAGGIDVIEGAVKVRGVENANTDLTRLEYKKELRRSILAFCYSFQEFFNEDTELLEEFRSSGFSNILLEEIRYHLWYLGQKTLLDLKTFSMGGNQLFMARITARGTELMENSIAEPGVADGPQD